MAQVVLHQDITYARAEQIYQLAKHWADKLDDAWQISQVDSWTKMGMRIVRAKDHRFMLALEQITEVLDKAEEDQNGRTRRDSGTDFSHRHKPMIVQAYSEAYRSACEGVPIEGYAYLYAAVAQAIGQI